MLPSSDPRKHYGQYAISAMKAGPPFFMPCNLQRLGSRRHLRRFCGELITVFGAHAAALRPGRMEAGEICPRISGPPRVGESVVARPYLPWQLGVTQLDGPLFDVQAELWEAKR